MARKTATATRQPRRLFRDRREAGRVLASLLTAYRGRADVVVLGLARGGVPVAFEVASALGAPLDAFIVRKLGAPGHEEFAVGALAAGGRIVLNDDVVRGLGVSPEELREIADREGLELDPARGGVPRRPPAAGRHGQDRDPGRRRSGHRGQHARRRHRAARFRTGADRGRGARRPRVHLPRVRRSGRRHGVRLHAHPVPGGGRIVLGFQPGRRRRGARAVGHADGRCDDTAPPRHPRWPSARRRWMRRAVFHPPTCSTT